MDTQEKNVQQETNDCEAQIKPAKRVLSAVVLRHQPGMAVQTNLKAALCNPKACRITHGQWGCDCG